jgi:sterol desaturase/sphingolipid hydroxylase (fatty acid hydroxylase superfamily)
MIENPKIPKLRSSNGTYSALEILQAIVLICFILYFGKTFSFLQFSLLIVLFFFRFVNGWRVKELTKWALYYLLLLLVSFIAIIVYLLFMQISEFSSAWELFREKLLEALNQISVLSQSDLKQLQKNKLHF